MPVRVYLADLRYDYSGYLATQCIPLGVAYMKAHIDRALPDLESSLLAYPGRLAEAIQQNSPDVLMVSNYVWNEALSLELAKLAKRSNPNTLVVMGGPNTSLEPERQIAYLATHPVLDVYKIREGDILASEMV